MFCDNPRCELHKHEDTGRHTLIVKVGDTSDYIRSIKNLGVIETKEYHNQIIVEPVSGQAFNLCDVCAGVLNVERDIREKHEDLPQLARAVTEAVNNGNN